MKRGTQTIIILAGLLVSASSSSFAQEPKPAAGGGLVNPFDNKVPGTIVTALGSVAAATQQPLTSNYLIQYRTELLRAQVQRSLMAALVAPKLESVLTPFLADPKTGSVAVPTSKAVLCDGRGPYEAIASEAAYLNTVSQSITNLQKKATTTNAVDAILGAFKETKINISYAEKNSSDVVNACQGDLEGNWPKTYYVQEAPVAAAPGSPLLNLIPFYSEIQTIFDVASSIFSFIHDFEQQQEINKYLVAHKSQLMKAASDLVAEQSKLVPTARSYAIGTFVDSMYNLSAVKIDLTKNADCTLGKFTVPASGKDVVARNKFASCYAYVWNAASASVQAAVAAAASYDSLADVSPDATKKLNEAIAKLNQNFDNLTSGGNVDVSALFTDLTQIISYAQQIQKAFSPSSKTASGGSGP